MAMIGATSCSGMTFCSITAMSGPTMTPPLNAASGVSSASGSISISMPRGGRAARDREQDVRVVQPADGRDRPIGQHLVPSDERPVDVREQQPDLPGSHLAHRSLR
jgi:hypothetical protein